MANDKKEIIDIVAEQVDYLRNNLRMEKAMEKERLRREYIQHKALRRAEYFFVYVEVVVAIAILVSVAIIVPRITDQTFNPFLIAIFSSAIFGIMLDATKRAIRGFEHGFKRTTLEYQYPEFKEKYSMF